MGWSDFIYLGIGLGLGLGINKLLAQKNAQQEPESSNEIVEKPLETHSNHQRVQELSNQLKQTKLAYQMASEMSKFKAGFLARTSHELRSPLSSTIGTLQLITNDLCDSPEEEREFAEQARGAALKMVELIDQLVFVAKTEYGTEKMDIEPLQLSKVFDEVEDLTCLQAANRSIGLNISPPEPNIYVLADLPRFRQVLVSLVDTAIAQMEEGSVNVSARASRESGYVYILIEDQRPVSAWSESWDLLKRDLEVKNGVNDSSLIKEEFDLSPGMRLLMNQTLLELMKGRLEVLAVPSEGEDDFTRTQCSIPLSNS
ncbi:MAG: HAMP domain-containing histidine kinase [Okeania sp. SIO2H7]|nr:HAMP domain-containing histidine kinase [Okeania sp. SIO2H7]